MVIAILNTFVIMLCIVEALKYLNAAFNCQKNKYYLLLDIPISFYYDITRNLLAVNFLIYPIENNNQKGFSGVGCVFFISV